MGLGLRVPCVGFRVYGRASGAGIAVQAQGVGFRVGAFPLL